MFESAEGRLERVAAACAARDAALLELALAVADAIERSAFAAAGLRHGATWLRAYTESSSADARRAVSLGRLLACHRVTREAVESGALSIGRAAVLASAVTDSRRWAYREVEETLLRQAAAVHRVEDVEVVMAHWCAMVDQDTAPGGDHVQRLSLQHRFDGGASLRGELDARTTEVLRVGLDTFDTGPDPLDGPLPVRPQAQRWADALGDLAGFALGHVNDGAGEEPASPTDGHGADTTDPSAATTDAPHAPADTTHEPADATEPGAFAADAADAADAAEPADADQVQPTPPAPARRSARTTNLVIDLPSLAGRARTDLDGIIATLDGRPISAWAARHLLCDTWIAAVLTDASGAVIDATERRADFTDTQRRLIAARDRGCVFPGCDAPPSWCDIHHLHWKSSGGGRSLDNGALLCRRHHTLLHQVDTDGSSWTIHRSLDGTGWHATSPTGTTWTGHPNQRPRSEPGRQPPPPDQQRPAA